LNQDKEARCEDGVLIYKQKFWHEKPRLDRTRVPLAAGSGRGGGCCSPQERFVCWCRRPPISPSRSALFKVQTHR
jgi:hypothetical protein